MDPDLPLLEQIARGDEAALRELMSRHKQTLHNFAYRYTANATDAAEITQEAFIRAWFNAGRFKPRAKVKSWLFSIAANLCRDQSRRNRKRSQDLSLDRHVSKAGGLTEVERVASNDPDAALQTEASEELRNLQLAIELLPHKLKTPFVLCVLEDHTHEEAAAILKTSTKAVETRIYRARKSLRETLENE